MSDTAVDELSESIAFVVDGVPLDTSTVITNFSAEAQIQNRQRRALGNPNTVITGTHTGYAISFRAADVDPAWEGMISTLTAAMRARTDVDVECIHTRRWPKSGTVAIHTYRKLKLVGSPRSSSPGEDSAFDVSLETGHDRIVA